MVLRGNRSSPTPIGAAAGEPGRRGGGSRSSGSGRGNGGSRHGGTNGASRSEESNGGFSGDASQPDKAVWAQPVAPVPPTQQQGRPWPQQGDLEYQKQVAHQLLDALDEESLWHLAHILQSRGLIKSALPGVPNVLGGPRCVAGVTAAGASYFPAEAGMSGAMAPGIPGAGVPFFSVAHAAVAPHTATITVNDSIGLQAAASAALAPAEPLPHSPQQTDVQSQPPVVASQVPASSQPQPCQNDSSAADRNASGSTGLEATPGLRGGGGDGAPANGDESSATTLILRNLPPYFDQQKAQEWVDEKGYAGMYDFFLWFPAKKTSRLNTSSYSFVNFRCAKDAQRFRQEFHLARFPLTEAESGGKQQWPLSIAVAKVQGFEENYIRFHHLLDDKSPTLCQPFFARDAIEQLSQETQEAAAATASSAPQLENVHEGPATTLIIRNLPASVDSQDAARQWLERAGFAGQYDFFLYLPAKRRRPEPASGQPGPPQGLGYAFVNFRAPGLASGCAEALNSRSLSDGDPVLNVVAARVQGLDVCISHFSSLGDNGRVVPWTDPAASAGRPLRQYQ